MIFYAHPGIARVEQMLQLLIDHGADMNARSKSGRTPLDAARARGWAEYAEMLRARGAKTAKVLDAAT